MADNDTQTGSQTEEQAKPVETDTETGLPAQELADPNAYPELAPVTAAEPAPEEAAPAEQQQNWKKKKWQPTPDDAPAPAPAEVAPADVAAEEPEGLPPDHPFWASKEAIALKKWVRDEIEHMQLGKSRQQREDILNP